MVRILVNIDVDDLARAEAFYTRAFGLHPGRRFGHDGEDGVELLGAEAPLYLLPTTAGTRPFPGAIARRDFRRHWSPVHLDFVVDELEAAIARAEHAGAVRESAIEDEAWGRIARFADPFGNGFCLVELSARGYDAIATR